MPNAHKQLRLIIVHQPAFTCEASIASS